MVGEEIGLYFEVSRKFQFLSQKMKKERKMCFGNINMTTVLQSRRITRLLL